VCCGPGSCWVKLQAAFFSIRGYFIIHLVIFTPWGVTKCQKSFPKKMLCDQASDENLFRMADHHPEPSHSADPGPVPPPWAQPPNCGSVVTLGPQGHHANEHHSEYNNDCKGDELIPFHGPDTTPATSGLSTPHNTRAAALRIVVEGLLEPGNNHRAGGVIEGSGAPSVRTIGCGKGRLDRGRPASGVRQHGARMLAFFDAVAVGAATVDLHFFSSPDYGPVHCLVLLQGGVLLHHLFIPVYCHRFSFRSLAKCA